MPGPPLIPLDTDRAPPKSADVVVVGGGIIGCSTALELAERGLKVVLLEKGAVAAEQSSRNWGWVRISRRDPREVPLMAESIRIWQTLSDRVGADVGYNQAGIAMIARTEEELDRNRAWLRNLDGYQMDARMLSAKETAEMHPDMAFPARGAMLNRHDGRAEPQRAGPAIAAAARAKGAVIVQNCAVRTLETEGGRVAGVTTEHGRIDADAVVVAAGIWSRLFLGNAGVELPQLRVVNTVLRTEPLEGGPEHAVAGAGFAARKRADGGYTISTLGADVFELTPDAFRLFRAFLPALMMERRAIRFRLGGRFMQEARTKRRWTRDEESPFERTRTMDPAPFSRRVDVALDELKRAFPVFSGAKVAQRWGGMIDVTPDAIPVISAVDARPGLHIATGFSGHGFGIGPGAGRLMADIVTGRPPLVDPHEFRFSRFSDGSKVRPIGGV